MKTVGVIGAGSFGITVATILSHNVNVLVYSRQQSEMPSTTTTTALNDENIRATSTERLPASCLAVVPSRHQA
ncbi:MAG: hypothetical protein LC127_16495 [Chitinophagales bacterium]|nr:hypothetical protein [Chitinophagales bacterium]